MHSRPFNTQSGYDVSNFVKLKFMLVSIYTDYLPSFLLNIYSLRKVELSFRFFKSSSFSAVLVDEITSMTANSSGGSAL